MSDTVRKSLLITGKVQGVWYRKSTKEKADELSLTGWVKNNPNGSVTVSAQGPAEKVDELIRWCHTGPEHAEVESVVVESQQSSSYEIFEIIR